MSSHKEWYTLDELSELKLPKFNKSRATIHRQATKEDWAKRQRQGVKGVAYEYHISALPEAAKEALGYYDQDFASIVPNQETALSRNLRQARDNLRLTRPEACERLGISKSTLQAWETGEREPSASQLLECAKAYNVSVLWLLSLEEATQKTQGDIDEESLATVIEAVEILLSMRESTISARKKAKLIVALYTKLTEMDKNENRSINDLIDLVV